MPAIKKPAELHAIDKEFVRVENFARWTSGSALRTGTAVNHRVRTRAKFFFEGDHKFFVRGVTYGPFAPDAAGAHFGTLDKAKDDFALIREA